MPINAGEFEPMMQYIHNKLPQLGFFSTLSQSNEDDSQNPPPAFASGGSTSDSITPPDFAAELSQIADSSLPSTSNADSSLDWLMNSAMFRLGQTPPAYAMMSPAPTFADGGSVDPSQPVEEDTTTSLRRLADFVRSLGGSDPGGQQLGKDTARAVVGLAQPLYGLDANNNPSLGGSLAHPPGIVDDILSLPHAAAKLAELAKKIPGRGPSITDVLPIIDPQWSKDAASRLSQLSTRMQANSGVGAPQGLGDNVIDIGSQLLQPGAFTRLGNVSRLIKPGSKVEKWTKNLMYQSAADDGSQETNNTVGK